VEKDAVVYVQKDTGKEFRQPFGTCVWAAGTAPRELTSRLAEKLSEKQVASVRKTGRLVVDQWLRLEGTNSLLCMGDCADIESDSLPQTAQVAAQQGAYLARLFNRDFLDPAQAVNAPLATKQKEFLFLKYYLSSAVAKPFNFLNLGENKSTVYMSSQFYI